MRVGRQLNYVILWEIILTCVDDSRTYKVAFSRELGGCEKRTLDVPFNIQCSNFLDLERGGPGFEIEFGLGVLIYSRQLDRVRVPFRSNTDV
jgi:hypothetical protein